MRVLHWVNDTQVAFHCPGCECAHIITVKGESTWGWNENEEEPTFTPSILVYGKEPLYFGELGQIRGHRCHSFVTGGKIMFLADSSHAMAGHTLPLPEWETLVM